MNYRSKIENFHFPCLFVAQVTKVPSRVTFKVTSENARIPTWSLHGFSFGRSWATQFPEKTNSNSYHDYTNSRSSISIPLCALTTHSDIKTYTYNSNNLSPSLSLSHTHTHTHTHIRRKATQHNTSKGRGVFHSLT